MAAPNNLKIKGEVTTEDEVLVETVGFPLGDLERGYLRYRMMWMLGSNQWFKLTPDGSKIILEGWSVSRTVHCLLKEYGTLVALEIKWGPYKIPINVIEVFDNVDITNLPMTLDTGYGPGFVVAERTMQSFRRMLEDPEEEGDQGARVRLLFHCLVDRRIFPELSLTDFASWGGEEVLALLSSWEGQAPGHIWSRFMPSEVGLEDGLDISVVEVAREESTRESTRDQGVLRVVEAEPIKAKGATGSERRLEREGSPELAEAAEGPVRHDVDEKGSQGKVNNKRRRNRRRGQRRNKGQGSGLWPRKLTRGQEMEVMRLLVLGVCPDASEDYILRNQLEYYSAEKRKEKAAPAYPGRGCQRPKEDAYGSGPGGWSLSAEEKKETLEEIEEGKKEMKAGEEEAAHDGSFESFMSMIANNSDSSVKSPRGETTAMGQLGDSPTPTSEGSPGSSGSSAPAKRPRVSLSVASSLSDMPALESPLMSKKLEGKAVVTISSESSEDGKLEKVKRMTLFELSRSSFLVYCDDVALGLTKESLEVSEDSGDEEEDVFEGGSDINSNPGGGDDRAQAEKGEDVGGEVDEDVKGEN